MAAKSDIISLSFISSHQDNEPIETDSERVIFYNQLMHELDEQYPGIKWLTAGQAAVHLHVSMSALKLSRTTGRLHCIAAPAFKKLPNNRIVYSKKEIARFHVRWLLIE